MTFDAIDFTKYPAAVPISQYMPAYAQNIQTDWGIVPNENGADGAAAVCELQVYAWRIRGRKYAVDEIAKTIVIGKEDITAKEFRNGLEIRGNCGVRLLDAKGTELKPEDHIGSKAMLLATDFRKHTFVYHIVVSS